MTVLVTGGAGFIGTHLVRALLVEGYEVALVVYTTPVAQDLLGKVVVIRADLSATDNIQRLPTGIDSVLHLAIYSPRVEEPADAEKCVRVNTLGTANVLEFCRANGVRRFVFSSSVAVYGFPRKMPVCEQDPLRPRTYYAISKIAAEYLCQKYHDEYGLSCACLRYSSVYGPGQRPDTVLPIFLRNAASGEKIKTFGQGKRTQDFVYVQDVVSANLLALRSEANGIFNIGSGVGTNVADLAETVRTIFPGTPSEIVADHSQKEDDLRICLDIARARRELGYRPRYSLREGLEEYSKNWGPA